METEGFQALEHDLQPYLPRLKEFPSTKALERSPLYREIRTKIQRILQAYDLSTTKTQVPTEPYYRCVAWNIERGMRFDAILSSLESHPILSEADILLLTETDYGMARSGNRHVAREIAQTLGMNYFFVPSYLNLAKGCGIEHEAEGENHWGLAGNAILSRYPIESPELIPLPNSLDKMQGREKRVGSQTAPMATIRLGDKKLDVVAVHLDMRSTPRHRRRQLEKILQTIKRRGSDPVLIGGDWNTSTYKAHRALSAIIGFWIRVFMGTHNMIRNHYPYPDRLFEKSLFRMVEAQGFDYKGCNEIGVGTSHYSVEDIKQFKNLREWIPNWCFRFIEWSLKEHDGRCSFKLDWFAQKGLNIMTKGEGTSTRKGKSLPPTVMGGLLYNEASPSDHDPIVVDFAL